MSVWKEFKQKLSNGINTEALHLSDYDHFLILVCDAYGTTHRNGNPLQYSCLENPMDGEAW